MEVVTEEKSFRQVVVWSWSSTFENVSHAFDTHAYINESDIKDVSRSEKSWSLKMIIMNEIAMQWLCCGDGGNDIDDAAITD